MDKLRMQSSNGVEDNITKIAQLFPDCVTEIVDERSGQPKHLIDFEKLKQNLSDSVMSERAERYQFTWPDKSKAILLANSPINATLRPCREDSIDFDNTQNLYIEGDNLDVLKCLKETYLHKVKMIYIDPPYNTGNDFVYEDDFAQSSEEYLANSGQFDEQGNRMFTNAESNGRFHTDWLNMIYPRLKVARDLLTDDGVIFISIDDNEQGNIQKVCNEIFGENNFVGQLIHQRAKGGGQAKYIVKGHDYILVYGKNLKNITLARKKIIQKPTTTINGEQYIINDDIIRKVFGKYDKSLGDRRCFYEELEKYKGKAKKEEIDRKLRTGELFLIENRFNMHTICRYEKVTDATSKMYSILKINPEDSIIKVLSEEGKKDLDALGIFGFSYPKPVEIIRQLVDAGTEKKGTNIILDFFSGSATTAHAVMQLNSEDGGNRKFIMVQLPEKTDEKSEAFKAGYKNICEIGKERIRRAGKKIKEESPSTTQDLDTGFRVLKLDSTNMQDIYYSPKDISQADLFSQVDNVKPDRTGEDLLFQVMLELGATLDSKIETTTVAGKTIYNVAEGYLVACFDPDVTDEVVKAIAQMQPAYAVLRDTSMKDDSTATNFEQIFKTYSPDTVTKIL
uniref:site-specific DNA-methyltransferase n=1 Tax=Segatella copri TaxID=165179 RepID=UPI0025FD1D44|nr:site-specific DNA-methyltransferase [Prevotella sp.]